MTATRYDAVISRKDKDGKVVEGDRDHVESVTDIWTFARELSSRDPNWALIATRSVD